MANQMLVNLFSVFFFLMFLLFRMERRGKGVGEGVGSGGSMNIRLKTSLELQPPSIRLGGELVRWFM